MTSLQKNHPKPQWIIGYTSRYHLMLDLDNIKEVKVTWLVKQIMKRWNKVGNALIVVSSITPYVISLKYTSINVPYMSIKGNSYHVIFNNNIGYNLTVKIIEMLAGLGIVERSFLYMRYFRGDMTLRTSKSIMSNNIKVRPKIIRYITNPYSNRCDHLILQYINFLNICSNLPRPLKDTKTVTNNRSNTTNNNTKHSTINPFL